MHVTCHWGAVCHDCMQGSPWAVCRSWCDTLGEPWLSWDLLWKSLILGLSLQPLLPPCVRPEQLRAPCPPAGGQHGGPWLCLTIREQLGQQYLESSCSLQDRRL